jgi:hypothetical protein
MMRNLTFAVLPSAEGLGNRVVPPRKTTFTSIHLCQDFSVLEIVDAVTPFALLDALVGMQ